MSRNRPTGVAGSRRRERRLNDQRSARRAKSWKAEELSQADELNTSRLPDALALIDVRVLDHIIIAGGQTLSLAERGLI